MPFSDIALTTLIQVSPTSPVCIKTLKMESQETFYLAEEIEWDMADRNQSMPCHCTYLEHNTKKRVDGIHHSLQSCFHQGRGVCSIYPHIGTWIYPKIYFLLLLSCPEGDHSTSIALMFLSHFIPLFIDTHHLSLPIICTRNTFFWLSVSFIWM